MGAEDKDLFVLLNELGITDAQLAKYYTDVDGTIDWERVEKNKSRLHILFPSPRMLIEGLTEELEATKEKLDEAHEKIEQLGRAASSLLNLHNDLQRYADKSVLLSLISIVIAAIALLVSVIF